MSNNVDVMLGDPKRAVRVLVIPLFISLAVASVNSFVDAYWCSFMGKDALAAVGIIASIQMIITGIGNGMGMGASSVASRKIGEGSPIKAGSILSQSWILMIVVSLALTPMFLLSIEPLSIILGGGGILDLCWEYGFPLIACTSVTIMQLVLSSSLRAEGDNRRSMVILVTGAGLNMVLDPVFAFVLGLGLAGLAWATIVSSAVSIVPVVYWYFLKRDTYVELKFHGFRFDMSEIREMLQVGLPKTLELDILWSFNLILILFVNNAGGTDGIAIFNTAWKYVDLVMLPASAVASAILTVCSAEHGAHEMGKMRIAYDYGVKLGMSITIVLAILVSLFSVPLSEVFTSSADAEFKTEFAYALQVYCYGTPFYAWLTVSSSFLQSMNLATCSMYSALIRNIVLSAGFALAWPQGMHALWWVFVIVEIFGWLLMVGWAEYGYRLKKRDWENDWNQ